MRIDNPSLVGKLESTAGSTAELTGSFSGSFVGTLVGTATTASYIDEAGVQGLTQLSSSLSLRVEELEVFSSSLDLTYATDSELSQVSSSIISTVQSDSSSFESRITVNEGNILELQTDSGSFSTRVSQNELDISNLQTDSGSFSSRITSLEEFSSSLDTTYATDSELSAVSSSLESTINTVSSSLSIRTTDLETASGSFSTRVSQNELDISNLQTDSGSFSSRVTSLEDFSSSLDSTFSTDAELNASSSALISGYTTADTNLSSSLAIDIQSNLDSIINLQTDSGSFSNRVTSLESFSSSLDSTFATDSEVASLSSSIASDITTNSGRLDTLEGKKLVSGSSQINHDNTTGFVANEHIDHSTVTLTAGDGLSGGGDITANRSFAVDSTVVRTSGNQTIGGVKTFTGNNTFGGLQTFNDISVNGTGSFAYIQSVTGSAKIIGDAYIILNANSPSERYAGIKVIDSGSTDTGSLEYDAVSNHWFYQSTNEGYASILLAGPTGSRESLIEPTTNTILKSVDGHHIGDSNITDNGTLITLGSNTTITGTLTASGTTIVSGSSQINHDSTTGFVSNEHIDHSGVSITAGSGLTGGGDLTTSRTISHADTSTQTSVNNSGRTYIQDITLDDFGHVTAISSATETVVDTNTTYSAGNGITLTGTTFSVAAGTSLTQDAGGLSHSDTSTLSGNYGGSADGIVIEDITVDALGHVTAIGTVDLDSRFLGISAKAADSELLDGIDSTSFLRSDAADSISSYTNQIKFPSNTILETTSVNQASLEIWQSTAGNDAFMQFHVSGDYAAYFGLKGDINDFAVGGWSMGANYYRVWHAGNDGAGSGLDADTLDGNQATAFYLASNPSGYTTNTGTVTSVGVSAGNGLTGGGTVTTSGTVTLNIGAGTGIDVAADAISVDVSDFMTNGSNNRVVTATGTDGMNAEANLTYDGNKFLIDGSGSVLFDIQGSQGQLFSVTDSLTGTLMSVNDISGLPILEVDSSDKVTMGTYGAPAITVNGSSAQVTGSLNGNATTATDSDTLDGFQPATTATADTIARRDTNADITMRYAFTEYVNMSHGVATRSSDSVFFSSNDTYIRKNNATGMRASLNVPTRTGGDASGTWGISITGNAATATTFSTGRTNYKGVTDGSVAGQLMWKNYGNNHTIFDASNSTSPSGTSVNNTNPDAAWAATYPTLMGWNGTNTYGVRVDISRYSESSGNADTVDSLHASSFLRSDANDTTSGTLSLSVDTTDALHFTANSTNDSRGIAFNSRTALSADYNDGWLRLNNASEFSNGIYTPGNFRADGIIRISSTQGITDVTGEYGTIQTNGTGQNSWQGYSIDGRIVFMHDNSTAFGIYNDVNNQWALYGITNSYIDLRHAGSVKLATKSTGVDVTGVLDATGDITGNTSDERLKTVVRKIDNPLDKIDKLEGFIYEYNDIAKEFGFEDEGERAGVSAQKVQQVLPQAVTRAPFDKCAETGESISGEDYLTVKYERLVPLLIESIKELKKEVNELREQLQK